jgi:hypothetical protein
MENLSFDSLPQRMATLEIKLDALLNIIKKPQPEETDELFTVEQLREYLPEKPARQTVYGWVCNRDIEFKKYGKRLYFRKSVVDRWLQNGRQIEGGRK